MSFYPAGRRSRSHAHGAGIPAGYGGSAGPVRTVPPSMSPSHSPTAARTESVLVRVKVRSTPDEMSVLRRMWARSGSAEPSSTHARMINSPV